MAKLNLSIHRTGGFSTLRISSTQVCEKKRLHLPEAHHWIKFVIWNLMRPSLTFSLTCAWDWERNHTQKWKPHERYASPELNANILRTFRDSPGGISGAQFVSIGWAVSRRWQGSRFWVSHGEWLPLTDTTTLSCARQPVCSANS
jgi:hypothetical protein